MIRRALTGVAVAVALVASGCGDDDEIDLATGEPIDLRQARVALDASGLAIVTDRRSPLAEDVEPGPVRSRVLEVRGGSWVDLLVFSDRAAARGATDAVARTEQVQDGGAFARAENVIAVTAEDAGAALRRQVREAMRGLRDDPGPERVVGDALEPDAVTRAPGEFLDRRVTIRGEVVNLLPSDAEDPQALVVGSPTPGYMLVVPSRGTELPAPFTGRASGERPTFEATGVVTLVGRDTPGVPEDWTERRAGLGPEIGRPALADAEIRVAG